MAKNIFFRLMFIPVVAITISNIPGFIGYHQTTRHIITGFVDFIFMSLCIWQGCRWIHIKLRLPSTTKRNTFPKIMLTCLLSGLYGSIIAGIFSLVWMKLAKEKVEWDPISTYALLTVPVIILFILVYEVLYLTKERDAANHTADELEDELTRAEMTALRNELDPHFVFNSLNTLSHLITHDSAKANLFNNKLAQVYKYFLMNKETKVVPVEKEFGFIKNYFFLLKIRHGDKMELHMDADLQNCNDMLVIPCALQILVENAIKHNEFTNDKPLKISITIEGKYLSIQNTARQRKIKFDSFGIGLRNLSTQYLLVSKKHIIVEDNETRFKVKLPIMKLSKTEYA